MCVYLSVFVCLFECVFVDIQTFALFAVMFVCVCVR